MAGKKKSNRPEKKKTLLEKTGRWQERNIVTLLVSKCKSRD